MNGRLGSLYVKKLRKEVLEISGRSFRADGGKNVRKKCGSKST